MHNFYIDSWLDYLPPYGESQPGLSFYMGHEGNGGPGQQSYSRFGMTRHSFMADGVVSLDAEGFVTTDGNGGFTTLVNTRQLVGSGLVGAGVSLAVQEAVTDQVYEQLGAHVEIFPNNDWSLRSNCYIPTGARTRRVAPMTLLAAMRGVDLEVARTLGQMSGEFYGGYYKYYTYADAKTEGGKVGLRGYVSRRLQAYVNLSKDDIFDYQVYGGVVWYLGGSAGTAPGCVHKKLTIPVERNHQVVMTTINQ